MTDYENLKRAIEAVLMASQQPVSWNHLRELFSESLTQIELQAVIDELRQDYQQSSVELVEVASGLRFQVKSQYSYWVNRSHEVKPPRYSQALLETLSIIVYRQPVTRGEVEAIRGVKVSSHIVKTLLEHEWVEIVGYRETPGRPALMGTTKKFLDHFNMKSLNELPDFPQLQTLVLAEE